MVGPRNPMSNLASGSYIAAINKALLSFQMIEEALKICVGLSYEVIAKAAPAPIVFRYDLAGINNAPLGKLIKMLLGDQLQCRTDQRSWESLEMAKLLRTQRLRPRVPR
jgi:hypothetical protein